MTIDSGRPQPARAQRADQPPINRIVCEVDGSLRGRQAVRAAIEFCRARGLDLELVGVVRLREFQASAEAPDPRNWPIEDVERELANAIALARRAGVAALSPSLTLTP